MDPSNRKIFSQDSAFLQQYQADLTKQIPNKSGTIASKPHAQQISLLTGKPAVAAAVQQQIQGTGHQPLSISTTTIKTEPVWHAGAQQPQAIRGPHGSIIHTASRIGGAPTKVTRIATINPYFRKWKKLKKVMKDLMFVNASVCDEVVRVEEKIAKAKEERRFLLRKLLHYQSYSDKVPFPGKLSPGGSSSKQAVSSAGEGSDSPSTKVVKSKPKKKPIIPAEKKKPVVPTVAKEILDSMQTKPKKSKSQVSKKVIPPLQLDATGRPVFPLIIGDLTVHSIGEIVNDRPGFHSSDNIYPEGYCSTRSYVSTLHHDRKCLYTCKISDAGSGPVFEIDADDNPDLVISSQSLSECHNILIKVINKSRGLDILEYTGRGADFFGLSHPIVQNLIQSCPGAKRCSGYKWVRFEISKSETPETVKTDAVHDPTISFDAFKIALIKGGMKSQQAFESSGSLRSLLTSKSIDGKK